VQADFLSDELRTRLAEADGQLRVDLAQREGHGCIAISLSRLLNPGATAFRTPNQDRGRDALGQWADRVAQSVEPDCFKLFDRSRVVAVLFHVSSDFQNMEVNRFERGSFLIGHTYIPVAARSSYGPALVRLMQGLERLAKAGG
jgi:hypothetical protein